MTGESRISSDCERPYRVSAVTQFGGEGAWSAGLGLFRKPAAGDDSQTRMCV